MKKYQVPVHPLEILDSFAVLTSDLGAVRDNSRMCSMFTADAHEVNVLKLAQFQQDIVNSRMRVAGQEYRLAEQNSQADQGDNERRFASAGQTVNQAIVLAN